MQIVAVDIGGTNARFALADIMPGCRPVLGEPVTFHTVDHGSFTSAWQAFARSIDTPLPRAAGIAVAGPVEGEMLKLTNNPWTIRPATLAGELGLDQLVLINDFSAVAHAVAWLEEAHLVHLAGPDEPLPEQGLISVIGPGTGLGVAQLLRRNGHAEVIATEGGHIDYAPLDSIETAMLNILRQRYLRVSVERIVSGPGLANIHEALAAIEQRPFTPRDDDALWTAATGDDDALARAALDRFCLAFGAVAGDLALAHGANAVAIGGGIPPRIVDYLRNSGFASRFVAKGRFEGRMARLPVRIVMHPQPGLFGAAAAFATRHLSQG